MCGASGTGLSRVSRNAKSGYTAHESTAFAMEWAHGSPPMNNNTPIRRRAGFWRAAVFVRPRLTTPAPLDPREVLPATGPRPGQNMTGHPARLGCRHTTPQPVERQILPIHGETGTAPASWPLKLLFFRHARRRSVPCAGYMKVL